MTYLKQLSWDDSVGIAKRSQRLIVGGKTINAIASAIAAIES